jgi:hypothetical protein
MAPRPTCAMPCAAPDVRKSPLDCHVAIGVEVAAGSSLAPAPAATSSFGRRLAGEPGAVTAAHAAVTAILSAK